MSDTTDIHAMIENAERMFGLVAAGSGLVIGFGLFDGQALVIMGAEGQEEMFKMEPQTALRMAANFTTAEGVELGLNCLSGDLLRAAECAEALSGGIQ